MLNILESPPAGLLDAEAVGLLELLGGPTLLHLPGRSPEPLFVSVLLHGNEDTGFYAVRELLRRYHGKTLPRAMSIFIGNVRAAAAGLRRLEGQPDYNRVWPGSDMPTTPEHELMARIVAEMERRQVFASVDVHNNTGINPHYGCVNRIDHRYLHLATLFSRTVVYFTRPRGVQSLAFSRLCPAVTVECGKPGQPHGIRHACDYLEACLHVTDLPIHPVAPHDIDLFHTVAIVKVPESVSFSFGELPGDIRFLSELDHLNFRELAAGTQLGWVDGASIPRLEAWDETGRDVSERYFTIEAGRL
ncbi:MAG: succinylglutamate desuccinylase/aspartoacylase family protein, partial [Gammaproteobacteria bacterium]|nr:succinylglutamate desuccinylase/aspartoacylase family protein [Gammaproteobacteria bacterium]